MSLIKKPAEIRPTVLFKALVYGQPGIGKTTLALSAQNSLLLDFDGGVTRVQPIYRKDVVQIVSWSDVIEVMKEDLSSYSTIVIDTVDKLLDCMNPEVMKKKGCAYSGALSQKGYGARKEMFRQFCSNIASLGKNLIFVAHEKEAKKGEDTILRPDIGGSSGADLIKDMHLVGYVEAQGQQRTVSFSPCERFYAKNSCELEPIINLPTLSGGENVFIDGIFKRIIEQNSKTQEIAKDYSLLVIDIGEECDKIVDAKTANEFVDFIRQTEHIWDSKQTGGVSLKRKVKELSLEFDKESGQYLDPQEPELDPESEAQLNNNLAKEK